MRARLTAIPGLMWVALGAYALQFSALTVLLIWRYVDVDALIGADIAYWYAHGVVKEPYFFGQAYNWPLESWLAVPLIWAGVRADVATSAVAATTVYGLFLLALWKLRTAPRALQAAVAVTPLAMPLKLLVAALLARNFGTLSAVSAACALVIVTSASTRSRALAAFAIGACAASFTPSLAAAVGIVLAHRSWRRSLPLVAAAAAGFALVASLGLFYVVHPGFVVRRVPPAGFSAANLIQALSHQHVLVGTAILSLATPALIGAIALLPRRRAIVGRAVAALGTTTALIFAMLGTERIHRYSPSPFYSVWRYWVPLATVGVILAVWSQASEALAGSPAPRAQSRALVAAVIAVASVTGAALQIRDLATRAPRWPSLATGTPNYIQVRATLPARCAQLRKLADPATQYVQLTGPATPELVLPNTCHWMSGVIVVDRFRDVRTWLPAYAQHSGLRPVAVPVRE